VIYGERGEEVKVTEGEVEWRRKKEDPVVYYHSSAHESLI
jgi:hypothetical protein